MTTVGPGPETREIARIRNTPSEYHFALLNRIESLPVKTLAVSCGEERRFEPDSPTSLLYSPATLQTKRLVENGSLDQRENPSKTMSFAKAQRGTTAV